MTAEILSIAVILAAILTPASCFGLRATTLPMVVFAQHAQNFRREQEEALIAENEADAIYAHGMGVRV